MAGNRDQLVNHMARKLLARNRFLLHLDAMHTWRGGRCDFCLDEGTYCDLDFRAVIKEWIEHLCPGCRKHMWPLTGQVQGVDREWTELMVKGIVEPTWEVVWQEFCLWNRHRHVLSPSPYLRNGVRHGVLRMVESLISYRYLSVNCHCDWDSIELYCEELKYEIKAVDGLHPRSWDLINTWLRLSLYSAARRTQLQGRLMPDPMWGPKEEAKFVRWQDLLGHTSDSDTE